VDAERGVTAQNFDVPVINVGRAMGSYDCGVDGSLVVVGIYDYEVGQADDVGGRRPGDRIQERCRALK